MFLMIGAVNCQIGTVWNRKHFHESVPYSCEVCSSHSDQDVDGLPGCNSMWSIDSYRYFRGTLKAICSSKTFATTYKTTWNNPEDHH
jgi:hypothetical protein